MNIQRRKKSKEIENIEVNFRWLQLFDTIKHCSWYFWDESFLKMSINDREKILHNYFQTFLFDCSQRRLVSKTRKKQILKASEIFLITTRKSEVYRLNNFWICKSSVERYYFFRFDVFYEQRIFENEDFENENFENGNFWKFSLTSRDFLHSELRLSDVKKLLRRFMIEKYSNKSIDDKELIFIKSNLIYWSEYELFDALQLTNIEIYLYFTIYEMKNFDVELDSYLNRSHVVRWISRDETFRESFSKTFVLRFFAHFVIRSLKIWVWSLNRWIRLIEN
jgi:hypothetical protein